MLLFIIAAVYPWRALIGPKGGANDKLGVVTLLQIHLRGDVNVCIQFYVSPIKRC